MTHNEGTWLAGAVTSAHVEAMRGQRTVGFTLWAMIGTITIQIDNLIGILLDRANEGV